MNFSQEGINADSNSIWEGRPRLFCGTVPSRANPRLGTCGVAPTRASAVHICYAGTASSRANPRLKTCRVAPTRASAVHLLARRISTELPTVSLKSI